uniref:Uncharacterized protein n=1 Tax=Leersia perrieri TaxID=77586 RepID=A0A0D9XG19_9ORYZ
MGTRKEVKTAIPIQFSGIDHHERQQHRGRDRGGVHGGSNAAGVEAEAASDWGLGEGDVDMIAAAIAKTLKPCDSSGLSWPSFVLYVLFLCVAAWLAFSFAKTKGGALELEYACAA